MSIRQLEVFLPPLKQVKTEVVKEVTATRRKQHLSSLQYYCALNALQHRKRVAMMEPMLGFAHGQVRPRPAVEGGTVFCGGSSTQDGGKRHQRKKHKCTASRGTFHVQHRESFQLGWICVSWTC